MKSNWIILLAVLSGFFAGFAKAGDHIAIDEGVRQPGASPQRGTLYRISANDHTAYLFGTIHVGEESGTPLGTAVTRALAQSKRLAIELDVREQQRFEQALTRHGLYEESDTVAQHLSGDSLRRLTQALARFDLSLDRVARMKPWLIANLLVGLDLERAGYIRSSGAEFALLSQAKEQAKTVLELESADYQLSLFDAMTPPEQERYLLENLADLEDGNALKKSRALIDAWIAGDSQTLEAWLQAERQEKTFASEFLLRVVLDKRNPEMANKIDTLMASDDTLFIGIGLLHLIGENGVPALLRSRGYTVEKLF